MALKGSLKTEAGAEVTYFKIIDFNMCSAVSPGGWGSVNLIAVNVVGYVNEESATAQLRPAMRFSVVLEGVAVGFSISDLYTALKTQDSRFTEMESC
jgi:uncharacterized membrane protein